MRPLLILALILAGCGPAAFRPPSASLPTTCGGSHGGSGTAQTQLRFVEASDTQVVLTFGASSASNDFDVPAFSLEPLEGTTAPRAYRLRISGTSSLNPDGTPSYRGLGTIEPGGRTVRGITFVDDAARSMTFTVTLERQACPFVGAKTYQYGKSPRAQIVLTFGASSLTIETSADVAGGAEVGTPVQASGIGYAPSSKIRVAVGGTQVFDTVANDDGTFDAGFWIPDHEPGLYDVAATDDQGHTGYTTVHVMARRTFLHGT
jgi:hypothetical protein